MNRIIYFAKSVEVVKPELAQLTAKKSKSNLYKSKELRTKLEKDFGKEKWGKIMIYNNFEIW